MKEPIINPLVSVTKKYISAFSALVENLPIERYQYVLVLIEEKEEKLTQQALSELLNIDKSYMVSIINYLSGKGYVVRKKNQDDRREQIIGLTAQARKDLPVIKAAFDKINSLSFNGLTSVEIATFIETLDKIQQNLSDSNPSEIIFNIKRLSNKT